MEEIPFCHWISIAGAVCGDSLLSDGSLEKVKVTPQAIIDDRAGGVFSLT